MATKAAARRPATRRANSPAKRVAKKLVAKPPIAKRAVAKRIAPKRASATNTPAKSHRANGAASGDLLATVSALIYRQAEALDAKQWHAFIDLFTDDGVYWAPTDPAHTHWDGMPSVFTEDKDLMTVRMNRVMHPQAWSQQAEWGTNHVVGNVMIERVDPKTGDVHARSRFHMMEIRRDDVRHFAGSYRHHLVKSGDGYRIKLQRVDLVNVQQPYEYVLQAWV